MLMIDRIDCFFGIMLIIECNIQVMVLFKRNDTKLKKVVTKYNSEFQVLK